MSTETTRGEASDGWTLNERLARALSAGDIQQVRAIRAEQEIRQDQTRRIVEWLRGEEAYGLATTYAASHNVKPNHMLAKGIAREFSGDPEGGENA